MNIHESYVSLEVAKLLKEAGFDWKVNFFYRDGILRNVLPDELFNGDFEDIEYYYKHIGIPHYSLNYNGGSSKFLEECSAPTLDVAQRWLREVHDYHISIIWQNSEWKPYKWIVQSPKLASLSIASYSNTYEEGQLEAIRFCLKQLIEK